MVQFCRKSFPRGLLEALRGRLERGSKKDLNIEGPWERIFIDYQRFEGPGDVARDLLFTILRGCWPFEDELPLEIQLSWILGAVWGASRAPKSHQVGSKRPRCPVRSHFLRVPLLERFL